jgi:hypothetical protein
MRRACPLRADRTVISGVHGRSRARHGDVRQARSRGLNQRSPKQPFVLRPHIALGRTVVPPTLGCCSMLTSTVAVAVISAAASSAATALLSNCHGIWLSLRKARRHLAGRIGRWWTRNEGYIPRFSRSRDFHHVAWWNTGPPGKPTPGAAGSRDSCPPGQAAVPFPVLAR